MMNEKVVYSVFFAIVCFYVFNNAEAQKDTIPTWIFEVKDFWNGEKISNSEYYFFLDYLVKSHAIHDSQQYEFLIRDNKVITYHIYDYAVSDSVVNMTLSKWSELNPQLVFVESDSSALLKIKPMSVRGLGLVASPQHYIFGEYDPNNGSVYVGDELNPKEQVETLSHEVGHFLGLGHHCSAVHLMSGNDCTGSDSGQAYESFGCEIKGHDDVENYNKDTCDFLRFSKFLNHDLEFNDLSYNLPDYSQPCLKMPDGMIYCS